MGFTTVNEWKNQHGIKFPRCFYRGLLSELFFRGISFSLPNLMSKPYQKHKASREGVWQLFRIIMSVCTVWEAIEMQKVGLWAHYACRWLSSIQVLNCCLLLFHKCHLAWTRVLVHYILPLFNFEGKNKTLFYSKPLPDNNVNSSTMNHCQKLGCNSI